MASEHKAKLVFDSLALYKDVPTAGDAKADKNWAAPVAPITVYSYALDVFDRTDGLRKAVVRHCHTHISLPTY